MFIDYYQDIDGGLIMFENYDHMTPEDYQELSMIAHWDIDQGQSVEQGPVGPGDNNFLHWIDWNILNIYNQVVDEYQQPLTSTNTIRINSSNQEHVDDMMVFI
jgi:hypothetical protein